MILKGRSFVFDPAKDAWLRENRGIGFERIIFAIESDVTLLIKTHPNKVKYPHQLMIETVIDGYGYAIPIVMQSDGSVFMKTIYPSRKVTKKFGRSDR
jgi:hypothetical protein